MAQKLQGNGLWESSRMMLPEQKERILQENFKFRNKRPPKPVLDEQEKEEIMRVLVQSLGMRDQARITLYHEFEDCAVIGVVDKIDPYTRTFIVDGERFKMEDIIGAVLE